ncbi:MAG: ABC transporter permease [Desulfovibrio sp.]|jgi:putative ABC transport system permease protein|nr:ABC transporter permease [Desulfovibrio sp.]
MSKSSSAHTVYSQYGGVAAGSFLFSLRMVRQIFSEQRIRAFLAISGVFLGALLLTGITHILGSVTLMLEMQARSLGSHVATVTAKAPAFGRSEDAPSNLRAQSGYAEESSQINFQKGGSANQVRHAPLAPVATLRREDLNAALAGVPQLSFGVPYTLMKGQIFRRDKTSNAQVMGVTENYPEIRDVAAAHGRFFNRTEEQEKSLVCVLGHALAERLFADSARAVGEYIRIERSPVRVLGVMAPKGADSSGTNMDEVVFLPLGTAMQRFASQDHVSGLFIAMKRREDIPHIAEALSTLLRSRHRLAPGQVDDFSIAFAGQVDEMTANAVGLVTMLGLIGGGISFLIGTLGIFSIMILMVHARKMEIGIQRAVGASKKYILRQFLGEAAIMAGTGGILGVFAALVLTQGIAFMGFLPSYLNVPLAMGICLISVFCGILAGGYPAWRASTMEILAVLR